jgi:hypothetical protein
MESGDALWMLMKTISTEQAGKRVISPLQWNANIFDCGVLHGRLL